MLLGAGSTKPGAIGIYHLVVHVVSVLGAWIGQLRPYLHCAILAVNITYFGLFGSLG